MLWCKRQICTALLCDRSFGQYNERHISIAGGSLGTANINKSLTSAAAQGNAAFGKAGQADSSRLDAFPSSEQGKLHRLHTATDAKQCCILLRQNRTAQHSTAQHSTAQHTSFHFVMPCSIDMQS